MEGHVGNILRFGYIFTAVFYICTCCGPSLKQYEIVIQFGSVPSWRQAPELRLTTRPRTLKCGLQFKVTREINPISREKNSIPKKNFGYFIRVLLF